METYGAVVTTGIYCRPGCPAQPRAENLRAFQLPAAAEAAGYRACLRCRPYRWPHSVSWTAPELVCRGVRLVLDGALDGGTEADLGARLGVSPRHLRRLFAEHLGVTLDGLARSARVHFARQLLDDTDLTITQVAHAAGFGSLRQFNRACRETFREPPRTLRARRRKADRLVADGGLLLRLPFRGPLDWQALLAYFATDAIAGVEQVSAETYRRTILVGGDPGVLEFTRGGTHHLLLRAHLPHWGELLHIVQQARKLANLDFELEQAIHELSQNLTVAPLIRARPGLRPPGTWDPFETGVRAIIGQQLSTTRANAIAGRLVARCGTRVPGLVTLGLTHTFPSPSTLAKADLDGLGLTPARTQAIRGFSQAALDGTVRLDRSAPLDELIGSLTALDGIALQTAHHLALRLGEPDAFPANESAVQDALGLHARRPSAAVEAVIEQWRPWRALVASHLSLTDASAVRRRTAPGSARPREPPEADGPAAIAARRRRCEPPHGGRALRRSDAARSPWSRDRPDALRTRRPAMRATPRGRVGRRGRPPDRRPQARPRQRRRVAAAGSRGGDIARRRPGSLVARGGRRGAGTRARRIGPPTSGRLRSSRDPSLIGPAIEELLRYDGPVERALNRWAAEDVELGGLKIRRGEGVIVILGSADRDPARFPDADVLDFGREDNKHVAFGRGSHYCLGAPLARLEAEIALTTLFRRLPELRLAVPVDELSWRPVPLFRSLVSLPLSW